MAATGNNQRFLQQNEDMVRTLAELGMRVAQETMQRKQAEAGQNNAANAIKSGVEAGVKISAGSGTPRISAPSGIRQPTSFYDDYLNRKAQNEQAQRQKQSMPTDPIKRMQASAQAEKQKGTTVISPMTDFVRECNMQREAEIAASLFAGMKDWTTSEELENVVAYAKMKPKEKEKLPESVRMEMDWKWKKELENAEQIARSENGSGQARAFLGSMGDSFSLGLTSLANRLANGKDAVLQEELYRIAHPVASGIGEATGLVLSGVGGPVRIAEKGVSAAVRPAARALGKGAGGLAARALGKNAATKFGTVATNAVQKGVAGGLESLAAGAATGGTQSLLSGKDLEETLEDAYRRGMAYGMIGFAGNALKGGVQGAQWYNARMQPSDVLTLNGSYDTMMEIPQRQLQLASGESAERQAVDKAVREMQDNADKVIVKRVQGGEGDRTSRKRITVNKDGTISISKKNKNLNISCDQGEHSEYFAKKRGKNSEIVAFEEPRYLIELMKENAISQRDYKANPHNQGGTAPKIVDLTTPGNSFELPPPWIEWLEEYASGGKIISPKE